MMPNTVDRCVGFLDLIDICISYLGFYMALGTSILGEITGVYIGLITIDCLLGLSKDKSLIFV